MAQIPQAKRFSAKVSKDEVKEKVDRAIKQSGGELRLKAEYYEKSAEVAMGSENPHFAILKPEIRVKEEDPWLNAIEFVMEFLNIHHMKFTQACIDVEYPHRKELPSGDVFSQMHLDEYFQDLLSASESLKEESFAKRVEEFGEETKKPAS